MAIICDICGTRSADDARYCETCGIPFTAKNEPEPSAPVIPYIPPPPAASPVADQDLINQILAETEQAPESFLQKLAALAKSPKLWTVIGLAMIGSSFFFPWMRLLPNRSFGIWRITLPFLVTGRASSLPFLSIGVVFVIAIVVCALQLWRGTRPSGAIQGAGVAIFLICLAALILSMRFWDASLSTGDAFPQLMKQKIILTDRAYLGVDRFFGAHPAIPVGAGWVRPASGLEFIKTMMGAGLFFALAGSLILALVPIVFGNESFGFTSQIPMPALVLCVTALIVTIFLMLVYEFMPGRWYVSKAAIQNKISGSSAAEQTFMTCLNLPRLPLECAMGLGDLYWSEKKSKEALEIFDSIAKAYPDYPNARQRLGLLYYNGRNYWKATPEFRKYLTRYPRNMKVKELLSDSLIMCGNDELRARRLQNGLKLLTEAYGLTPKNRKNHALNLSIGRAYLRNRQVKEGIQYLRVAGDLKPYDYELQYEIGNLFRNVGNYDGSIFFYKRAVAAKQDFAEGYDALGDIYRDKKREPEAAAEWYRKAIAASEFSDTAAGAKAKLRRMGY